MRKILFLFALLVMSGRPCLAKDYSDNILSLLTLPPESTTQAKVTAMLGKPGMIEETRKKVKWHYTTNQHDLIICWNKRSDLLENFSYKSLEVKKTICNGESFKQLRNGATNVMAAIKLLGSPADMKTKNATQEMHYAYENSVLRLFFRNNILVDFTLLTQPGK